MARLMWTSLIVVTAMFALVTQLFIISPAMAQDRNTTSAQNRDNTKLIVDLKNNTITLLNTTTNETISVKEYMPEAPLNTTTIENITTNQENAIDGTTTIENITTNQENATNGNLTPENTIKNETLTENNKNTTTNVNLTSKFNALQGK